MPPNRRLKTSYSPQPGRPGPIPFLSAVEEEGSRHIRYQTPQPSGASTHHLTLTPVPTSPLVSTSKMPRGSRAKAALPKERVVKREDPQEQVNYPPHWPLSKTNMEKIMAMDLYPRDDIRCYTRRIPFKGSKEFFLRKTGRNRFDVYEYRFSAVDMNGSRKQYWIVWDYYNGLVRVHDFFDCCKPGKTEPGNAVKDKVNPGLCEISHNITGGNLHAQGYWLPYEAAKALAAKFCYRIRYALTIVFGEDFPNICLPEGHEDHGKFEIDPAIISACQMKAKQQYEAEKQRLQEPRQSSPMINIRYNTPVDSSTGISSHSFSPQETPERESRFFDPVRNGYTSGGSLKSECSSPWSVIGSISSPVIGYEYPIATTWSQYTSIRENNSIGNRLQEPCYMETPLGNANILVSPFLHTNDSRNSLLMPAVHQTSCKESQQRWHSTILSGSQTPPQICSEILKSKRSGVSANPSRQVISGRGSPIQQPEPFRKEKRTKVSHQTFQQPGPQQCYGLKMVEPMGIDSSITLGRQGYLSPLAHTKSVIHRADELEDPEDLRTVEAACSLVSMNLADHELHVRNKRNRKTSLSRFPYKRHSVG